MVQENKFQETKLFTLENNGWVGNCEPKTTRKRCKILQNIYQDTKIEISIHALTSVSTPQTLNITGYIKKHKVTILVDSCSTHSIIDKILAKSLNCFVNPVENFQV
jgi:hypothetical protein